MMHALGFGHMHNADDRDDYIDIKWENMDPENHSAFTKYYTGWFSNFDTPFDVRSSMNYYRRAYSNNGEDVIVPRDRKYLETIGMEQFSAGDGTRVNRMYKCRTH